MKKLIITLFAAVILTGCGAAGKQVKTEAHSGPKPPDQEAVNLFTEGQLAEMGNDYVNALRFYYRALLKDSTNTVILNAIGNAHLKLEQYGNAILYLQRSAVIDDSNAETWSYLGEAWLGKQKFPESAEAFSRAAVIQPGNVNIRRYLIYIYANLGDNEKLLEQYLAILNLSGYDPDIASKAADLMFRMERITQARSLYERILMQDPQNVDALLGLADIDIFRGDTTAAEARYQKAMEIQPDNPEVDFKFNRLLRMQGDWEGLIGFYRSKLAPDSSNDIARVNLAEAYFWKEDYDSARYYLKPYYDIEGLHSSISHLIGKVETGLENYGTAEKYLRQALTDEPGNPGIYLDLGICLDEGGKKDSAVVILQAASEQFPDEPVFNRYMAQLLMELEDYPSAIGAIEQALKTEPGDIVSLSILANLYHEAGNFLKSDSVYEKALVLAPTDPTLLNNYAYSLAVRDTLLIRAHKMVMNALEQEPENASFLDTAAWILFRQGKIGEAAKYIDLALKHAEEEASDELYYHAGMIYRDSDREKATGYFKKALELNPESEARVELESK